MESLNRYLLPLKRILALPTLGHYKCTFSVYIHILLIFLNRYTVEILLSSTLCRPKTFSAFSVLVNLPSKDKKICPFNSKASLPLRGVSKSFQLFAQIVSEVQDPF